MVVGLIHRDSATDAAVDATVDLAASANEPPRRLRSGEPRFAGTAHEEDA